MPSFTAFALDRLLEPAASKSVDKSVTSSNPVPKPKNLPRPTPASSSILEGRNGAPTLERKLSRPQISPALYATPEATPVPESPSSFPPSPYIINHKRRGPSLLKSFSDVDSAACEKVLEEDKINGSAKAEEAKVTDTAEIHSLNSESQEKLNDLDDSSIKLELGNGAQNFPPEEECMNGLRDSEIGNSHWKPGSNSAGKNLTVEKDVPKLVILNLEKDSECEDFFDPRESMSCASSTDFEDNTGAESSVQRAATTPTGEFFDAWDELSSESGRQPSFHDIEAELRLDLLTEIEKRTQAEEALKNMQSQWRRIRKELALVGLRLPACPVDMVEDDQVLDANPAEELSQQLYVARFVSDSIGRGVAKAEIETEMEAQIETKNFEIARLLDRIHYYETVNQEMSQRNQEAVEMGRRHRLVRKRRQRWVWASIAGVITLGTAALAWSYLPPVRGSYASNDSSTSEHTMQPSDDISINR